MDPKNKPFLIVSIFLAVLGAGLAIAGSVGGGIAALAIGVVGILLHVKANKN